MEEFILHLGPAHLRLQIIRRHLERIDQDPLLAMKWGLVRVVEEKGHMGVFFGLGAPELLQPVVAQDLPENVGLFHRGKRDLELAIIVIIREGDVP